VHEDARAGAVFSSRSGVLKHAPNQDGDDCRPTPIAQSAEENEGLDLADSCAPYACLWIPPAAYRQCNEGSANEV